MSIGAGSFTLTRFQVLEKPGSRDIKSVIQVLKDNRIVPIGMDEVRETSMGWCHPHTGEPDFQDALDWAYGEALVFGLRVDEKRVPGTLYRLQVRHLLEEIDQQHKGKTDPGEQAASGGSRRLKELARERVKMELLKRTLPSIKLVEIVWNLQNNELWVTSTSQSVLDAFDECFVHAFQLPYVRMSPGVAGLDFARLLSGTGVGHSEELRIDALTQAVPWGGMAESALDIPGEKSGDPGGEIPFLPNA
jgi:hypothetical protein